MIESCSVWSPCRKIPMPTRCHERSAFKGRIALQLHSKAVDGLDLLKPIHVHSLLLKVRL